MSNRTESLRKSAGLVLLVVALVLASYGAAIFGGFVADDFDILSRVSRGGPFGIWSSHGSNFFRPMFSLSLYYDQAVWGLESIPLHARNLGLHALTALLVGYATTLLVRDPAAKEDGLALGAAAAVLFATLPSHLEPVAWISGRGDLLVGVFCSGALILAVMYLRGAHWRTLVGSGAATTAALLTKEAALTFPVTLIGLAIVYPRMMPRVTVARRWRGVTAMMLGVTLGYVALRLGVVGRMIGGYGASVHTRFDLEVLGKLFLYFPSRIVFPGIGTTSIGGTLVPLNFIPLGVVAAIAAFALFRGRHTGTARIALGCILAMWGALLPVANLSVVADTSEGTRFLYLPSVFLVIGLVSALGSALPRRTLVVTTIVVGVLGTAYNATTSQNWRRAGETAEKVVAEVAAVRAERIWVLTVPDNYGGAYCLRNGLETGVWLFGDDDRPERVMPLLLLSGDEEPEVTRSARGRYVVGGLVSPDLGIHERRLSNEEAALVHMTRLEDGSVTVSIDLSDGDAVLYVKSGEVVTLDGSTLPSPGSPRTGSPSGSHPGLPGSDG
ncbi:MAG: hypothetical protein R3E97_01075 [Candidatus Eisenbacteria bacterium]